MAQKNSFVRTHFFIDRKFQGRYMLTFLIPMLVMLFFMIFTLYFASRTIINTTTRILMYDIESRISSELQDQPSPTVEKYQDVLGGIEDYLKKFSTNKDVKKNLMSSLLWVFGAGIFLVMVQIVLLTIFFSHKVAGPVYRFEKICHNIIEGKYTDEVRLRQGDEMQNLARLFNEALRLTRLRMVELQSSSNQDNVGKKTEDIQF
jgi:nitrate/nitrite-specific signal transduction histidine kinase